MTKSNTAPLTTSQGRREDAVFPVPTTTPRRAGAWSASVRE